MDNQRIAKVAEDIALQLAKSMRGLETHLNAEHSVYVYALVLSDDFAQVLGYANTLQHFTASSGGPRQKWYFANWFATGMELDTTALCAFLGDATDDDIAVQASWVMAIIEGLRLARSRGALSFRGSPVAAFCSMIDSRNAIWIERESARAANPPELLNSFEQEREAAATEGYGAGETEQLPLYFAFKRMHN
jgi:hypothetical protein